MILACTICNSKIFEAAYVSSNRIINKENMVFIYNIVLYYQKEDKLASFVEKWINLETIRLSEINQTD